MNNIYYIIAIFNIISIYIYVNYNYIYKRNVYIVSNIPGGGAVKYLNDITNHYLDNKYIYVKSKAHLNSIIFKKNDILFIQHIIDTDISIDDLINNIKCKTYLSIHDFHWLFGKNNYDGVASAYLLDDHEIMNSINYNKLKKLLSLINVIIYPSKFTYNIYNKFYKNTNYIIVDHNDYYINNDSLWVPLIKNNTINIGNLSSFDEYKGKEYILDLINKYKKYKNYEINFIIVGQNSPSYNETEYYDYIKKYNIHGLTYLNKWGETWCYSLTKALNTGLPIIYNNIGAFKERIIDKPQHFKAFDYENDDINKIYNSFENMLDYIIKNNGKYKNFYSNTEILYNSFYNKLFS
jgi:hypothetical protein